MFFGWNWGNSGYCYKHDWQFVGDNRIE